MLEVSISKLPGMMKSACCAGGINQLITLYDEECLLCWMYQSVNYLV